MNQKILFNGQEYNRVEDMPADVRQMYEQMMGMFADKNQDGIPDMFQQGNAGEAVQMPMTVAATQMIVVDGQVYHNVADLPPDVRSRYEAKMAEVDKNQDGVPDVLASFLPGGATAQSTPTNWQTAVSPPSSQPDTPHVTITDSSSNNLVMVAAAVIFFLLLVIAALVAIMVL